MLKRPLRACCQEIRAFWEKKRALRACCQENRAFWEKKRPLRACCQGIRAFKDLPEEVNEVREVLGWFPGLRDIKKISKNLLIT